MCKTILTVISLFFSYVLFAQCGFETDIEMSPSSETGVYCPYDTIKLNIAEPFDSYQWYYDFDGSASNLTPIAGATASVIEVSAGEYGYAFFYVELRRDTCTQLSDPVVIDTWVFGSPAIEHSPQSEYCRGDSTMIRNAFGRYASYQWYRDGQPIEGATDSIYWVKKPGTYVIFTAPFECPELELTSGIGPTFTFTGPVVPEISFEDGVLSASSGPNYQWSLNGQVIAGATQQSYEPEESGLYTVTVHDGSGCRPTSEPFFFTPTGTQQPGWAGQFRLFPNPVKDELKIEGPQSHALQARLLAADGKELWQGRYPTSGPLSISLQAYPDGPYWLLLSREGESAAFRIIKN